MQIAGTPDRVGSHPLITRIEKPLFYIRKMTLEGIGQRIDKSYPMRILEKFAQLYE